MGYLSELFLAQLGGLTMAGMLGPSLLTFRSARAADAVTLGTAAKEGILTCSQCGAHYSGRRSICGGKIV